jgi:hypothetical protein
VVFGYFHRIWLDFMEHHGKFFSLDPQSQWTKCISFVYELKSSALSQQSLDFDFVQASE